VDKLLLWNDDYKLGVDYIDNAHKELFTVIYKFQSVIEEKTVEYRKSLCSAMLRYLIKYTSSHFASEEAYMKKCLYEGYDVHKQLHDNLKNRTIPFLVDMFEREKYSDAAITRFIAVLSSWLASHILIEDRAITGDFSGRWNSDSGASDIIDLIDKEFQLFATDLFGLETKLVNRHYEGEYLGENIYSFYCTVKSEEKTYNTLFLSEEEFIKYVLKHVTGNNCQDLSELSIEAIKMIVQSWSKAAVSMVCKSNKIEVTDVTVSKEADYSSFFKNTAPQQSLMWIAGKYEVGLAIKEDM